MRTFTVLSLLAVGVAHAELNPLQVMIEAARKQSPDVAELLQKGLPTLKARGGAASWGQDYLFAVETAGEPSVSIDKQPPVRMTRAPNSQVWYHLAKLAPGGVLHNYEFFAGGKSMGQNFSYDVAVYPKDSYPQEGVPRGKQSAKQSIAGKIYPDMTADYWIYVNPGYDAVKGGPLMVWQDGETIVDAADLVRMRMQIVTDNLVHKKIIPPMIHVLISPGVAKDGSSMRSVQYDTVSDRYARFVMEDVLPEVERTYKIRGDGYSRAIGGISSGGICALNAAWYFPDKFSRVLSNVGSFTALQWHPDRNQDGGNIYPFRVRREPKKNIRVWLADSTDDLETMAGDWPLQGIQLANSLKLRGYDFHFRFGAGMHSIGQGAHDLPESLAWLWRGYDPAKTEEIYEMDPAERQRPLFRVKIANREAW